MLTRDQKIQNANSFIRKSFGIDTYETINRFNINTHYSFLSIRLYGILIKRLDKGDIPNNLSKQDLLCVKQNIILDVIMKTEILIESTLVLFHTLSTGYYPSVPMNMAYYDFKLIHPIIEKIKKKKYNMLKILGLPNLKTLPISISEKKFLRKLFLDFGNYCYETLEKVSNFYERYRIIYGKSKHGLSIRLGLNQVLNPQSEPEIEFNESILEAIDRKKKTDMPTGCIISHPKNQTGDVNLGFYNTCSILKFGDKLLDEIIRTNTFLKEVIEFVCQNHLIHAINCGESYLPLIKRKGRIGMAIYSKKKLSEEDSNQAGDIFKKIFPLMNTNAYFKTIREYRTPKINKSLKKQVVTNIWLSKT